MKNKRSLFIVVAMVLLLAVVIGMGGTTFAKYITQDDVSGTATVAKWGYDVTIDAGTPSTLFNTDYKDTSIVVAAADNKADVKATSTTLAPGTTGFFTISIDGTAEVLSKVTFDLTANSDVKLASADNGDAGDYFPVRWTVTQTTGGAVVDDAENLTLAELSAWFEDHNAITEPQTRFAADWTVTWEWDFENNDGKTDPAQIAAAINANNARDTALGNMAALENAGTNGSSYTIDFALEIVVEQIQNADR